MSLCQSINKWRHTSSFQEDVSPAKALCQRQKKCAFRQAPVYSAREGSFLPAPEIVVNNHREGHHQSQESAPRNLLEDHSSTNLP